MREDPEGALKDIFAQEVASIVWRRNRFFKAEGKDVTAMARRFNSECKSFNLDHALQVLELFRTSMQNRGFQSELDCAFLKTLKTFLTKYDLEGNLEATYQDCMRTSRLRDKRDLSGDECRLKVLQAIDERINQVRALKEAHERSDEESTRLEKVLLVVPQDLEDRMRYEAHLDRLEERVINRWERVRRIGLGQSVVPSLDVHMKD